MAKKQKPVQGPCVVYLESKGWLDPRGLWTERLQDAEVLTTSTRAKSRARKAFRYSREPVLVQVVPVLVLDSPAQAQWYEASPKKR